MVGQGLGIGVGEDLVKYLGVIGNLKVRCSEVSLGHCDLWVGGVTWQFEVWGDTWRREEQCVPGIGDGSRVEFRLSSWRCWES